jgi:hypothetical protein
MKIDEDGFGIGEGGFKIPNKINNALWLKNVGKYLKVKEVDKKRKRLMGYKNESIDEAFFDEPLSFEKKENNEYLFTIDNTTYKVGFIDEGNKHVSIHLYRKGPETASNTGKRIYSTILAIVKAYLKKKKPKSIEFSTDFDHYSFVKLLVKEAKDVIKKYKVDKVISNNTEVSFVARKKRFLEK